jgi:hypothetical protein
MYTSPHGGDDRVTRATVVVSQLQLYEGINAGETALCLYSVFTDREVDILLVLLDCLQLLLML